jgi:probable DNA metabolism protein
MGGVYRYDGTFSGLLTVAALLLTERIIPDAISVDAPLQQNLFADVIIVETDPELIEKFRGELAKRLTPSSLKLIRRSFLADQPGREMMIYHYLMLAWEIGKQIGGMLAHPHVEPLWKLSQKVGSEAHRYKGFVRFQETTGGFFYSAISPDHRILPLIAPHFAARFADQHWLIHDMHHGEGIIHDRILRKCLILPMEIDGDPDLTRAEERFQALWRSYFSSIAISERENLRLQRSKVPLKVRPWLVEFARGG